MEYWYEVTALRKFSRWDQSGQAVRLMIHVINDEVVEVVEVS